MRELDVVHHMTLSHEKILPAVIIEIDKLATPAGVLSAGRGQPRRTGHIFKYALPVAKQRIALVG
jgi:hypothetical protein